MAVRWHTIDGVVKMKRIFFLALAGLALVNISCTDKDRLLSAVQNGEELPNGSILPVFLFQNYPNPFNVSTSISFATAHTQPIRLTIKTEGWVTVATLVDTTERAGQYNWYWNADGLPSGEYFAVLEGGGLTETIRMRLVK